MAVSYTRNLRLRIDSNLTANSKYNLERLDTLGSTFLVDTTDTLNLRSKTDILIEPESADLGGSGSGGVLSIGTASHVLDTVSVFGSEFWLSSPASILDQASGGTKYLNIQYKSDLNGSVDTVANRTLSIDPDGADRSLVLGGNLSVTGGNLAFSLTGNSALTLPTTGTVATLAGSEVLTNKTLDADLNSFSNIENADIKAAAGIVYSKLNLTGGILNADVSNSASISYSKLNLSASIVNADISGIAAIARSKIATGSLSHVLINDGSGALSSEATLSKSRGGTGADNSSIIFPSTGTLVTEAGTETLTNKALDGLQNTFTNIPLSAVAISGSITNADISPTAAIAYSKLALTGSIVNADISSSAAISRSKVAAGSVDHVLINDNSGNLSSEATLSIARGGTAASTALAARNNLLPSQTGNNGRVLQTDGTNSSWAAVGTGSVTSVDLATPAEFTVSGNPITTSGTLTISKAVQSANRIYSGPVSGGTAVPTFRLLVDADIPTTYFDTQLATKTTADLTEGSNLYYTNEKVDDRVSALIQSGTGITWTYDDSGNTLTGNVSLSAFSTTNLSEGSNLYYTDERSQDSVGNILTDTSEIDFTYSDATPSITADLKTTTVVAGSYGSATQVTALTVDSKGRLTTAASTTIAIPSTQVTDFTTASQTVIAGYKTSTNWTNAQGTTKAVTHNFATAEIDVHIYDIDSGEELLVDSIVRTNTNTVTLTSSQAPDVAGSGWHIVVRK